MSLQIETLETLTDLEDVLGQTFKWSGLTLPCFASGVRKTSRIGSGGFALESDLTLIARQNLFTLTSPQAGETLDFDNLAYQILAVTAVHDIYLRLECDDPNRGA